MRGPRLELRGLRRSFAGLVAVDDPSFSVPAGSRFGFVGRNGAGKTTTMRIVCGLLAADAGSVLCDGRPIDARVRERIGYMPEERGLYPKMRIGDRLEYFAMLHGTSHEQGRAAARAWLERLGLGERARVSDFPCKRLGCRCEEQDNAARRSSFRSAPAACQYFGEAPIVAVAATQSRSVPSFTGVDLAGANDVIVHVGARRSVIVHADGNLRRLVTTRVRWGSLVVATTPGTLNAESPMFVDVTLPSLNALTLQEHGPRFRHRLHKRARAMPSGVALCATSDSRIGASSGSRTRLRAPARSRRCRVASAR